MPKTCIYMFLIVLGVFDSIPIVATLQIFKKYLPPACYFKLKKYTTANFKTVESCISWNYFEAKLKTADLYSCSLELLRLLCSKNEDNEKCVKVFHISTNDKDNGVVEPSLKRTTRMVYHFLTYIYQRNVLASLIKYVLLSPLIRQFEQFDYGNKGIFYVIKSRLYELLYECVLASFNGSNYDNYLICNSLILIQSRLKHKMKLYKKGAAISTIYLDVPNNLHCWTKKNPKNQKTQKQKLTINGH